MKYIQIACTEQDGNCPKTDQLNIPNKNNFYLGINICFSAILVCTNIKFHFPSPLWDYPVIVVVLFVCTILSHSMLVPADEGVISFHWKLFVQGLINACIDYS